MSRRIALALAVFAGILSARVAQAQECQSPQAGWVFCDDFESSTDQDANLGLWDDQGLHPSNLVLTSDPANVHSGARALEITAHKGVDTGGGPTKWFLPGYDEVYLRFWVRFDPNYNYTHHLVMLVANEASNKWSGFGTAGCRPSGSNFFISNIEPFSDWGANQPPGAWGFYTYSVDMQCDPGATCSNYADPQQICNDCSTKGSPCTNGLECCWGTNDITTPPVVSPLGQWVCVEGRVAANSGGQANGSQTLFIDGNQVGQWSNIEFRTDDNLKLNALALNHYVTDDVYAAGQTQETVWFDDVVVSTQPIGCGPGAAGSGGGGGSGGSPSGGSGGGGAVSGGGGAGGSTASGGAPAGGASAQGGSKASNADSGGGCGCRFAGGRERRGFVLALALGLLLGVRRRRAARRLRGVVSAANRF